MSLSLKNAGIDDDDREAVARFCEKDFSKTKSLTVQAPTDEVDINKIMARIQKGQTVMTSAGEPWFGDVSEFNGLQDAIIKVQEADDLFMQFPAQVRERFENDPVQFFDFMQDPKNTDEAISLGIALKRPVPEPAPSPSTDPALKSGSAAGTTQ